MEILIIFISFNFSYIAFEINQIIIYQNQILFWYYTFLFPVSDAKCGDHKMHKFNPCNPARDVGVSLSSYKTRTRLRELEPCATVIGRFGVSPNLHVVVVFKFMIYDTTRSAESFISFCSVMRALVRL
jgi:hypothetical protein